MDGGVARLGEAIEALDVPVDRDAIVAAIAQRDRLDAKITAAVAAYDAAELWDADGATSMTRWLVAECRMSDSMARRQVRTAKRLTQLPAMAEAYAAGAVSGGQVDLLAKAVKPRHVELFADIEAGMARTWPWLDIEGTTTVLRDWFTKADALIENAPAEDSRRSFVHLDELLDDRSRVRGELVGDDRAIVADALRLAGRSDDELDGRRRTRAERLADALVELCARFLHDHDTPRAHPGRQRPGVNVVIDAADLAATTLRQLGITSTDALDAYLDSHPTTAAERAWYQTGLDRQREPGGGGATTLSGHEISPALAAAFCCDATMRRVLSTGSTVLDYGRPMATLPRSVRDAVILRDRRCRFRGCPRTIDWCEVHHVVHREHGGPDAVDNCVLLCARHHHIVHRDGWDAKLTPDGTLRVTDPDGRTHTTRPPGPGNGPPPSQPDLFDQSA